MATSLMREIELSQTSRDRRTFGRSTRNRQERRLEPSQNKGRTDTSILFNENGFGVLPLALVQYDARWCGSLAGFSDLVGQCYHHMAASDHKFKATIPSPLFRYYCYTALWNRVLMLQVREGLTYALRQDLDRLTSWGEFSLPAPIARYLFSLGEISALSGAKARFHIQPEMMEFRPDRVNGLGGFYPNALHDIGIIGRYAVVPAPGVYCHAIQTDVQANTAGAAWNPYWTLPAGPMPTRCHDAQEVRMSQNCLGWAPNVQWTGNYRPLYQQLGWTPTAVPRDTRASTLNVSPSTLTWVKERLNSYSSIKMLMIGFEYMSIEKASPFALGKCEIEAKPIDGNDSLEPPFTMGHMHLTACQRMTGGEFAGALACALRYDLPEPNEAHVFQGMPFYLSTSEQKLSGYESLRDKIEAYTVTGDWVDNDRSRNFHCDSFDRAVSIRRMICLSQIRK